MTHPHHFHTTAVEADDRLPIIRVTRDFACTPGALQHAHTDPALFAQWIGPDNATVQILNWDARDGGSWHYQTTVGGIDHGFRGCFHEVSADRIVQTFSHLASPGTVALETVTFQPLGNHRSRLRAQLLVDSFEARDAWLASGLKQGITDAHTKLASITKAPE